MRTWFDPRHRRSGRWPGGLPPTAATLPVEAPRVPQREYRYFWAVAHTLRPRARIWATKLSMIGDIPAPLLAERVPVALTRSLSRRRADGRKAPPALALGGGAPRMPMGAIGKDHATLDPYKIRGKI